MKALHERGEADAERAAARARLLGTVADVRKATAPSALAGLALSAAKTRVVDAARGSAKAAGSQRAAITGAVIASALYIFRKPLIAALTRWRNKEPDHDRTQ